MISSASSQACVIGDRKGLSGITKRGERCSDLIIQVLRAHRQPPRLWMGNSSGSKGDKASTEEKRDNVRSRAFMNELSILTPVSLRHGGVCETVSGPY